MVLNDINNIIEEVKAKRPLIHSITNPISINQCANTILAVGARPIMAEHPKEVLEITKTASALMLNLGNITDVRIESMLISAKAAREEKIPCILDLVGIACSKLRRNFAIKLIENNDITLIKGNYSEIAALYNCEYKAIGVDTDKSLDEEYISKAAAELSKKYNTLILASGKVDIATDGEKVIYIKNGTSQLATVTGTGCMLGALLSCCLAVKQDINAVITGAAVLGICGELSETEKGSGSFMTRLMDNLSTFGEVEEKDLKWEEISIEKF